MKDKDIKILWGRSGNRCAICQIELTASGDRETLGEMAHIVARASNGSRGESSLTVQERDSYNNLILLCPNDHTEIDKNYQDWSVDKLHRIKTEHESWVSEQLNTGNISFTQIDNSDFLQQRFEVWQELSRDHITIALSLTPLQISGDQINALDEGSQQILEQSWLPGRREQVNHYHTRPSEFGVVNEIFRDLPSRSGHSYHIFRNGHCEYLHELGGKADRLTEIATKKGDNLDGATHAIRYTDYAEAILSGIEWLELVWREILPFEYMDFKCVILNADNTNMFSYEDSRDGGVYGYRSRSKRLMVEEILQREHNTETLVFEILKWVSNCYGLVLNSKMDGQGNLRRPVRMR